MAVTNWKFYYNPAGFSKGTEFTSQILSASMSYGRTKYLDDYGAGTLTITINNSSNFITNFSFNTLILLDTDRTDATYGNDPGNVYAVQEITFSDYPAMLVYLLQLLFVLMDLVGLVVFKQTPCR